MMKKRISKLLAVTLSFAMVLGMVGCGSSDSASDSSAENATEDAVVEETEAEDTEDADSSSETTDTEYVDEINFVSYLNEEAALIQAADFEEATGVKVNVYYYESADYLQGFQVLVNGGTDVDVLCMNGQDVRYFATNGLIQTWDADNAVVQKLTDAAVDQYTFNDNLYAIGASGGASSGVYWNMDVIDQYGGEIPETLDEMIELNNQLKEDGLSLFAFGGGSIYMWPMWFFSVMAQTSGDPVGYTESQLRGEATFTDEASIEAFEILQRFAEEGMYQTGFLGTDSDGGKAVFFNGQSAAFYGGTWENDGVRNSGLENVQLIGFPIVKDGATSLQTGNASDGAWAIYSGIDPARQATSEAFIDFITEEDTILKYRDSENDSLRSANTFSCNKNVEVADADGLTETTIELMSTCTFTHPDWIYPPEVTTALQEALQMLMGMEMTPEETGQYVQDVLDELLANGYDFDATGTTE